MWSPAPGVLNASAALLTAYGASIPVLCLTSEIPTAYLGRGLGHLHEMPDQLASLRSFTKWAANVLSPAMAPGLLDEAMFQAQSGRPGPTALAAPWDVLPMRAEVDPPAAAGAHDRPPSTTRASSAPPSSSCRRSGR